MARLAGNTRELQLDRSAIMVHGEAGVGKTWLLGDVITHYGDDGYIVTFPGEEGLLTLKDRGLPYEVIESWPDWEKFKLDIHKGKLKHVKALGLDGVTYLYKMIMRAFTSAEVPDGKDYQKAHARFENQVIEISRAVPLTFWTIRSKRRENQVTQQEFICPDLPGVYASGIAGLMNFVWYLEAKPAAGGIERVLYTTAKAATVLRQRLPRPLPIVVKNPTWKVLLGELEKASGNDKGGK